MALAAASPDLTPPSPTVELARPGRRRRRGAVLTILAATMIDLVASSSAARAEGRLCPLARDVAGEPANDRDDREEPKDGPGPQSVASAPGEDPGAAHASQAASHPPPRPDPSELERQGTVIGAIRIQTIDVFDESIPEENKAFFRLVNTLHVKTREQTVRQQLLFVEGEPFVQHRLEETERNLRGLPYIQDASVVAESVDADGRVTVLVTTRDEWSTGVSVRFGVSGGKSTTGLSLSEGNLFGRGKHLEFDVRNEIDRTTQDITYEDRNLFGTRLNFSIGHRDASDGRGNALSFGLPFYSLETRRAWGTDLLENLDQFSYRQEGEILQRFDHDLTDLSAFLGFSRGLLGGITTRWILGYEMRDDLFEPDGALPIGYPSEAIPASRTISGPTIMFSRIRSDYIKVKYFERFARYEDFNLGKQIDLRLHLSPSAFGATENEVLYDFSGSVGYRMGEYGYLLANGGLRGRVGAGPETLLHAEATNYYVKWWRQTLVTRVVADFGHNLDATDLLTLGGDNGLRGFGVRRFDGESRFLINIEDRFHTYRQVFRLFQFGAAAFIDVGNAWGGLRVSEVCNRERFAPAQAPIDPNFNTRSVCRAVVEDNAFGNLKADIGVSLLADIVRASQSNFVRLNVAFPLNAEKYDEATILLSIGKAGGF